MHTELAYSDRFNWISVWIDGCYLAESWRTEVLLAVNSLRETHQKQKYPFYWSVSPNGLFLKQHRYFKRLGNRLSPNSSSVPLSPGRGGSGWGQFEERGEISLKTAEKLAGRGLNCLHWEALIVHSNIQIR